MEEPVSLSTEDDIVQSAEAPEVIAESALPTADQGMDTERDASAPAE
ncbi:MAG: hypothetical protein JSS48_14685, partial [Nitrospira sp.]|nr:hypothetical protein [Nitrospira sp.]